ncbi:dipeptidase [Aminicella lysinilytica]|uniref:dipeptidase n=1 Tax=Aminicella lysinilytica TaxID=433323 RepID=UPI0026F2158A|nr:dipeptidase [Aminicella lysinilytica]
MNKKDMKIIDMHCDSMIECWRHDERSLRSGKGHLNLELMQKNHGMCQFFACYLSRIEMKTMDPYDLFHKIYGCFKEEMENNKDIISQVYSAEDIEKNVEKGMLSAFLTIEDGVFVDGKIERIQEVYDLGVRLITLMWGYENSIGFPCFDDPKENAQGLKPFGIEVVNKMNDLGMIIDVSHMSEGGFYDVAKYSKKPFMATHSCSKALCNHKRNLTDDQLKVIGEKGCIAGVNFESSFLKEGSEYATIDQIIEHMRHMTDKAGVDAIGFGSDFDGIETTGELVDYSGFSKVLNAMEKYYTDDEIDKITHENALRVMKEIIGK